MKVLPVVPRHGPTGTRPVATLPLHHLFRTDIPMLSAHDAAMSQSVQLLSCFRACASCLAPPRGSLFALLPEWAAAVFVAAVLIHEKRSSSRNTKKANACVLICVPD